MAGNTVSEGTNGDRCLRPRDTAAIQVATGCFPGHGTFVTQVEILCSRTPGESYGRLQLIAVT